MSFPSTFRHFGGKWSLFLLIPFLYLFAFVLSSLAAEVTIDSTVHTTNTTHNGTTLTTVFTSDLIGYAFYRDASGACVYRKTADAGITWTTSSVAIDSQTDCIRIAVWYDQWTPGNTTGTLIHVVTMDTSGDDLWYNYLNTSNDALGTSTPLLITTGQAPTFAAGANLHALTRSTDGTLFVGVQDANDSFVIRCSLNCVNATSSWSEAGTNPFDLANDWLLLAPLPQGNVLAVRWDISADDVQSKIWSATSSSWSASWTDIDLVCSNNGTYDGHFGLTINKISNAVYMAYACDLQAIGGNDDDIRTAIYFAASSTWSITSSTITNTTSGITGVKVGLDSNTGNIYVVYSARTGATATSTDVFYRISTSTMNSWGPEQPRLNTTSTDIYGLRLDGLNNERIYATWIDGGANSLEGNTVANLTPSDYTQSAYKFFDNTNSAAVGPVYAATNASSVIPGAAGAFRLRMLIHVGGDGADIGKDYFKLQVATSTPGGCDAAFSGETYADVATSTGDIRFYDNPGVSNGVVLTATSTDPTHGTDTVVNETYTESNPFTNSIAKIFGGQDGKWDFALQNFASPALTTHCFRIVKSDDSLLTNYSFIPEAIVNQTPLITQVTLNGGSNIPLTEGSLTLVQATATVTDMNGYQDINFDAMTGRFFRSGVGLACTVNDNNCYALDFSCFSSNCAGISCEATCNIYMQYFADPTDSGTPWETENWQAYLLTYDARGATSSATSTGVEVLTLLGIDASSSVNYPNLRSGSTTDPITNQLILKSSGNASIDGRIYGVDMISGSNAISVGQQRYATSSVSFASATVLLADPGATLDLNIPKTTSALNPGTSTMYWGISIPSVQPTGNYTGANTFIGTVNPLPWP